MKRTIRHADGSEETVEGTAEELAQYERLLRERERGPRPSSRKPGVLKGKELTELLRQPPSYLSPILVAPRCQVCGRQYCNGSHWGTPWYPFEFYKITCSAVPP